MNFENIDGLVQNVITVFGTAAMFASICFSNFGGFLEAARRDPFYSKSNNWRKRHHVPMRRRDGKRKEEGSWLK